MTASCFAEMLSSRQFPGAMTLRCFAFQPTAEQVAQENKDKEKKANLMMFPPTAGACPFQSAPFCDLFNSPSILWEG